MAKNRRVVRKVKHYQSVIEDQVWPVVAAMCVLGGFLIGSVVAYLRFDDPRWYANAVTYLIGIPILMTAGMVVLIQLPKSVLRRTMQFALLIAMALHVVLMVILIETEIIKPFWEPENANDLNRRELVHMNNYHPLQLENPQQRPQHDFERPVEVETPDVETPEVEREEPEPQEQPEPEQVEPTPTPPQEPTVDPNVVQRQTPSETAPRAADTQSRMSRQQRTTELRPSPANVATPRTQPSEQARPQVAAAQPTVQRNQPDAQQVRRTQADQPQATTQQAQPQLTRQTTERTPLAQSTAAPTMQRQVNEPTITPSSQAEAVNVTAQSQQTRPDQVQPNNIAATRQQTAAPSTERQQVEVTPNVTASVERQTQRRQNPAENTPQLAQSARPTPNQRRQIATNPQAMTQVAADAPSRAPVQSQSQPTQVAAQTSPVQRQRIDTPTARATPTEPTLNPSPSTTPTQVTRSQSQNAPTPNTVADATPTTRQRQNPNSPVAPQTTSQVTPIAGAQTNRPSTSVAQVEAAAATTSRQSTPSVTPNAMARAAPTPQPSQTQPNPASPTVNRASQAEPAPTVARTERPQPNQRTATNTPPAPSTVAAATVSNAPSNTAPAPSPTATLQANTGALNRQQSVSPSVTRPETGAATPSSSPSTQIARNAPSRAQTSNAPTLASNDAPSQTPNRTERAAVVAASPTNVSSPATSEANRTASNPTAEPARMAISRSLGGVAGIGQSANMDRALPTTGSIAPVPSTSARRAESSQADNPGPALSPSAPSAIARSVADAQAPSASNAPTTVEVAAMAGADRSDDLAASSSAALTRSDSNADPGEVTAAKGSGEVDFGPTQLVSEQVDPADAGQASGGGQPRVNTETQSNQLARAETGGSTQAAISADQLANTPVAPPADGGGQPVPLTPSIDATAATRTMANDVSPTTGGPALAAEAGPASETSTAPDTASATEIARATAIDAASGDPAAGGGAPQVAENAPANNMTRAKSGSAPELATTGPQSPTAVAAAAPMGNGEPEEDEDEKERLARVAAGRAAGEPGGAPASAASTANGPPTEVTGGQLLGETALARAETIEASPGQPAAGGGSGSPSRAESGPQLAVNTKADLPTVAGAPDSAGNPQGAPIAAQGAPVDRVAEGAAVPSADGAVGAMAAANIQVAESGATPGPAIGRRESGPSGEAGPTMGEATVAGAIGRQAAADAGPSIGAVADILVPANTLAMAEGPSGADAIVGDMGMETTEMSRQAASGMTAVNIEAPEGLGGIGEEYALEVGVVNRRAQRDSQEVHIKPARFIRSDVGGQPSINATAVVSAEAFNSRSGLPDLRGSGGPEAAAGAPPPETEQAIEKGLTFLARHQSQDGSWSLHNYGAGRPGYEKETSVLISDTAATGLALLAFQGAGYHHKEHRYKANCAAAVQWLIDNQKEDGDLYVALDDRPANQAVWLYSHAIATLALCEAYGMTQDPNLREPTQKALDFIVEGQHEQRGGWRYSPGFSSDTSVTGWMMMALKSGDLANLDVPEKTYDGIRAWLDAAQASDSQPHLYRYNPWAPKTAEQAHGRQASKTMTSVGLLMRLYSGWTRDNPNMIRGADYLAEHLPALGTRREPQRDTYYWYYATQVMFHMGGDHWEKWNAQLHPLLVNSQEANGPLAGSWDPLNPIRDEWGPHAGRIYVTTMNLLSLEVYYRHLPIYEDTAN